MSNKAIEEYLKEKQARESAEKAKHDAEIQRLADADSKRREAEAAERKKKEDAAQAERDKQFDQELEADARADFYAGNPGAPESLWESTRDEMRKRVLLRRTEEANATPQHSLYRYIR